MHRVFSPYLIRGPLIPYILRHPGCTPSKRNRARTRIRSHTRTGNWACTCTLSSNLAYVLACACTLGCTLTLACTRLRTGAFRLLYRQSSDRIPIPPNIDIAIDLHLQILAAARNRTAHRAPVHDGDWGLAHLSQHGEDGLGERVRRVGGDGVVRADDVRRGVDVEHRRGRAGVVRRVVLVFFVVVVDFREGIRRRVCGAGELYWRPVFNGAGEVMKVGVAGEDGDQLFESILGSCVHGRGFREVRLEESEVWKGEAPSVEGKCVCVC